MNTFRTSQKLNKIYNLGSRKKSSAKRKTVRRKAFKMLLKMLVIVRMFVDYVIHFLFGLYYNSKKQVVPLVQNNTLLDSATSLANQIRNGTRTSEEIVTAFINRAKEVNPFINAIVDQRFEDAVKEAKVIDSDIANGKLTEKDFEAKPFLGVPFTTKDSTACKGMLQTFGLVSRQNTRSEEDADAVVLFKKAGGILIATTNIPEVNLWQETRNNLIGQTCNPYDTTRTVGGSSGGEASLVTSCGSAIGIGTDIGGSVRVPAFYCGLFGHKPTSDITPLRGLTNRTGKEKNSMVVVGPLCRYASDLAPSLKVLVGDKAPLLHFNEEININSINFYYMEESNDIRSGSISEEMRKVMFRVINYFNDKVTNEEYTPKKVFFEEMKYSFRLWRYSMSKENSNFPYELANREGEINVWSEVPKKLIGKSDFTLASILYLINLKLPTENTQWAESTLQKLRNDILETLGNNGVLLYPSYTNTANYHYEAFLKPFNFGYWAIFNALHLPVTQIPMGLGKDGLPVGIQVIAAPYNDRLCFTVAKELEEAFGGWVPFLEEVNKKN